MLIGRYTFCLGNNPTDYSYPTFRKYLDQVYRYAGAASLEKELSAVSIDDIHIVKSAFIQPWFNIMEYVKDDTINFLLDIKQVKRF